jgi:hypothetical protein
METLFDQFPFLKALVTLYMPCYPFFLDNPLPESTHEFFRLICSAVYQGIPEYSNYTEAASKRRNG